MTKDQLRDIEAALRELRSAIQQLDISIEHFREVGELPANKEYPDIIDELERLSDGLESAFDEIEGDILR